MPTVGTGILNFPDRPRDRNPNRGGTLSHTAGQARHQVYAPLSQGNITHCTLLRYSCGVLGGTEGSKPSVKSQGSTGNNRGINSSTADSARAHAMVVKPAKPYCACAQPMPGAGATATSGGSDGPKRTELRKPAGCIKFMAPAEK